VVVYAWRKVMRQTKIICDCGCSKKVEKEGFSLDQVGVCSLIGDDKLKLREPLHFVDISHIRTWVEKVLKVLPRMEEELKIYPKPRGEISLQDFEEQFYF
jgi:hypothetical protein